MLLLQILFGLGLATRWVYPDVGAISVALFALSGLVLSVSLVNIAPAGIIRIRARRTLPWQKLLGFVLGLLLALVAGLEDEKVSAALFALGTSLTALAHYAAGYVSNDA